MDETKDTTVQARVERLVEINTQASQDRAAAEAAHGQVWTTAELQAEFTVLGFMAPFCVVARKADGVKGSVEFQHSPRFYFNFQKD